MEKLTEIQKAELLIKEVEQKRQAEFAEKVNALCEEYGYALQPFSEIRIVKAQ
jgi:hypothetical protein